MKLRIAPDSQGHVIELAILAAVGAGLTVLASNIAQLNLGSWAAVVGAGITIALSVINNLEKS